MTTLSCCGTDITMESAKDNFIAFLHTCDIDEQTFAVIVSVVVIVISIIALFVSRSKRRKRTNVLILGISESGKTYMFSKLVAGDCKPKETLTSLKENESTLMTQNNARIHLCSIFLQYTSKLTLLRYLLSYWGFS